MLSKKYSSSIKYSLNSFNKSEVVFIELMDFCNNSEYCSETKALFKLYNNLEVLANFI